MSPCWYGLRSCNAGSHTLGASVAFLNGIATASPALASILHPSVVSSVCSFMLSFVWSPIGSCDT